MHSVNLIRRPEYTVDFRVLGIRVHAVQIPEVMARMTDWIRDHEAGRYIAVTGMHGAMEAHRNSHFKEVLNAASLVVSDGMPIVWLGRWQRHPLARRVYGPELMETFCRTTAHEYRHFFYGGAPGVADHLARTMRNRYGIRVAGAYSPPFRPLTLDEDEEVVARIQAAGPDVLWVGLSTPKQECWMYEHRHRLTVPVMVGVGAAFDFATGRVKQAPSWMREHGLEWLFRLIQEPRRLWRRYLIYGSKFAWNVSLELLNLKTFE